MKISTRQYVDNQNKWMRRWVISQFAATNRAVDKVEDTYKSDKAGSNEWRGQLKDQAGTFVTRRELWSAVVAVIAIVLGIMSYVK